MNHARLIIGILLRSQDVNMSCLIYQAEIQYHFNNITMRIKMASKLQENTSRFRKTPKGVLTNMYDHMRNRHDVSFSLKEFHLRFLGDDKFNRLFNEWVKSNYKKECKPSLDRINNKKPYTESNTQMLTWAENRYKQSKLDGKRGRSPRVIQMIGDKIIRVFNSQRNAVKELGINQSNLSSVLTGKRKTVSGYSFKYENPELLEKNND